MIFQIVEAFIDRATKFWNDANMTGAHHMYFSMVSELMSQSYDREWVL